MPPGEIDGISQSIVGALLYCATNTRPDVSFAVARLCRAMARPTPALLLHAQRVLCYLYETRDLGLNFQSSEKPLFGMTDSDWATRHSTSGNVFVLNRAFAHLPPDARFSTASFVL